MSVSDNYRRITEKEAERLAPMYAPSWKDPSIPKKQRSIVSKELIAAKNGHWIAPYRVYVDLVGKAAEKIGDCFRVLDVGCASGYYVEVLGMKTWWKELRATYTGVDYSTHMIEWAKEFYPNEDFYVAEGTELPFADNHFDLSIDGCCLLHVVGWRKQLAEISRTAKSYVMLHRLPVTKDNGGIRHFIKDAYEIPCIEIHFNAEEIANVMMSLGFSLDTELLLSDHGEYESRSLLFRKIGG